MNVGYEFVSEQRESSRHVRLRKLTQSARTLRDDVSLCIFLNQGRSHDYKK